MGALRPWEVLWPHLLSVILRERDKSSLTKKKKKKNLHNSPTFILIAVIIAFCFSYLLILWNHCRGPWTLNSGIPGWRKNGGWGIGKRGEGEKDLFDPPTCLLLHSQVCLYEDIGVFSNIKARLGSKWTQDMRCEHPRVTLWSERVSLPEIAIIAERCGFNGGICG